MVAHIPPGSLSPVLMIKKKIKKFTQIRQIRNLNQKSEQHPKNRQVGHIIIWCSKNNSRYSKFHLTVRQQTFVIIWNGFGFEVRLQHTQRVKPVFSKHYMAKSCNTALTAEQWPLNHSQWRKVASDVTSHYVKEHKVSQPLCCLLLTLLLKKKISEICCHALPPQLITFLFNFHPCFYNHGNAPLRGISPCLNCCQGYLPRQRSKNSCSWSFLLA